MLGIPEQFLDCSVYMYAEESHAYKGEQSGGSGFVVGVPLNVNSEETQLYVVTNEHVIRKQRSPVIRLNRIDGKVQVQSTNKVRWIVDVANDLAVLPLVINEEDLKLAWVPSWRLLEESIVKRLNVRPGDEVFMVGRFVGHDGLQRNTPSVRFGNISKMPTSAAGESDHSEELFLVDCRSIPGCSGSPAFLMFDPTRTYPPHWPPPEPYDPNWHGPWLLGVDSFHLPTFEPILFEKDADRKVVPNLWVRSNSGMAGVVPAWKIRNILDSNELIAQRDHRDGQITAEKLRDLC
jgi:Trypsin-like peptidase domain